MKADVLSGHIGSGSFSCHVNNGEEINLAYDSPTNESPHLLLNLPLISHL